MSISYPNQMVFLCGFPKSGTTSLAAALRITEQFNCTTPKETFHFGDDFYGVSSRIGSDDLPGYMQCFNGDDFPETKYLDATTGYIFSDVALQAIKNNIANPKLIILIRNPFDLVEAWHNEMLFSFNEDLQDLRAAIEQSQRRRNGAEVPKKCKSKLFLDYYQVTSIGTQTAEAIKLFGECNVLIIKSSDLADSNYISKKLSDFLEINVSVVIPRLNERKAHRFSWISKLVYEPPIFSSQIYQLRIYFLRRQFRIINFLKAKLVVTKKKSADEKNERFSEKFIIHANNEIQLLAQIVGDEVLEWQR